MRRQRGFTLVELVMVIVVMGILAYGTVSYITRTAELYQNSVTGDRLGSAGRALIDQLAREIRSALPNSVRTASSGSMSCLELVPTLQAGSYLRLPDATDPTFSVMPLFETPAVSTGLRAAVYPISSSEIYRDPGALRAVSPVITNPAADLVLSATNPPASAAPVSISFVSGHLFPTGSPQKRWFLVREPVSFCADGNGRIWRYQGNGGSYTFAATQPVPPALGSPAAGRWLLGDSLYPPPACGGSGALFQVLDATLQRNAVVLLDLCLKGSNGQQLQLVHEVQLRNVP